MNNTKNNITINKPISLVIEDASKSIISVINEINLHPTLLKMILKDVYNQIDELAESQYNREKAEYEQALIELSKQNNDTKQESTEK